MPTCSVILNIFLNGKGIWPRVKGHAIVACLGHCIDFDTWHAHTRWRQFDINCADIKKELPRGFMQRVQNLQK